MDEGRDYTATAGRYRDSSVTPKAGAKLTPELIREYFLHLGSLPTKEDVDAMLNNGERLKELQLGIRPETAASIAADIVDAYHKRHLDPHYSRLVFIEGKPSEYMPSMDFAYRYALLSGLCKSVAWSHENGHWTLKLDWAEWVD